MNLSVANAAEDLSHDMCVPERVCPQGRSWLAVRVVVVEVGNVWVGVGEGPVCVAV